VLAVVRKVAKSTTTVLIRGETGTGKELIAGAIHHNSLRASRNFVKVNCAALQENLLESELFGHKKGAFTSADVDKRGLFEIADGGTLFLDEVGELPPAMQVKLLRVIQERSVRPVGAREETAIDVRILSATHQNLDAMVAAGEFREDIYYRLNVIELRVPPLRERGEDLEALAQQIVVRRTESLGLGPRRLSEAALRQLRAHDYPGNVRELENVLERALTLSESETIGPEEIRLRAAPRQAPVKAPGGGGAVVDPSLPLSEQLEAIEREAIEQALEQARYNKTEAAKLLGMSFRQLRYRIKKLGIE
jgi:two-component system, NtrC family, response regulator PilR